MVQSAKELTPVQYNGAAIKATHTKITQKRLCFRAHWHDRMEFLRIREGALKIEHGSLQITALPNELVMIPPKISHKAYAGDEGVSYDVLMFDVRSFYNETEICRELLPALYHGDLRLNAISRHPDTVAAFDRVFQACDEASLALISHLFLFLDAFIRNDTVSYRKADEKRGNRIIGESITYMEEHFTEPINMAELSLHFGYSPAHFSRKFKKVTGLSPVHYLNIVRLEEAYRKILQDKEEISEIALECGFSDANYFTRRFKKHFGMPPSHYRKEKP